MSIYWHLFGSESNKDLKDLAEKISPMGSKLKNDILLNSKLFNKIKIVYQNKEKMVRNPKTNEKIFKEKSYKLHFKIGKTLHKRINSSIN